MRMPSIKAVAAELRRCKPRKGDYPDERDPEQSDVIDVRLQVYEAGDWAVHTGDSSYDQDHRGFWGASSLSPTSNCREVAIDLIDQCADHAAQCGEEV